MRRKAALETLLTPILLCFLFIIFGFRAANAAVQRVLTLEEMIEMALAASPEIKMAEQDISAAKSDYKQARGTLSPQLDIFGATGPAEDSRYPTVVLTGKNTGVIVSHDEEWKVGIFGRLDFVIIQPLYTFGKISNRKDAAALGIEARTAAREEQRNKVVLNVKELYYAYLVALHGKSAATEADDYIKDATRRIKRLIELRAKNAGPGDLYRMEAFAAQVKAFAAMADSGSRTACVALKKAIGLPENEEFRPKETELPKNPANLEPEGEYVQRALERRPEIIQVKKGVEAGGKLAEAARADLYPSFFAAAAGSFAGAPERQKFDNTYIPDEFNHSYAGLFAGAQWRLDFGIGKGKLDKAGAEYRKMRATQEFAERNIPVEVVKYYQDALEARKSYAAYEEAVLGSRRWIVTAFSNFDSGIGAARDMLDAIDRYGKNQGEYLKALYSYHVALARLDYAISKGRDTL